MRPGPVYRPRAEPVRLKEIDESGPSSSTFILARFPLGVIKILALILSPAISPETSADSAAAPLVRPGK